MNFLKDFLKNLAGVTLVILVFAGIGFLLLLPMILAEYVAEWLAYVTFAVYVLGAVAAFTWSERS